MTIDNKFDTKFNCEFNAETPENCILKYEFAGKMLVSAIGFAHADNVNQARVIKVEFVVII